MSNLTTLERARQSLTAALAPACEGRADAAAPYLFEAELRLIRGGREDLGHALAEERAQGVCRAGTRQAIRETINKVDAELEPGVETPGFVPASDGGDR